MNMTYDAKERPRIVEKQAVEMTLTFDAKQKPRIKESKKTENNFFVEA